MQTTRYILILILLLFGFCASSLAQEKKETVKLSLSVHPGPTHINPSYVCWIEDSVGNFLRTVFVTQMVGKGFYSSADLHEGEWTSGEKRIEGALPVWAHKRNIRNPEGGFTPTQKTPVTDAYTGATPVQNTQIYMKIDKRKLPKFRLMFEINQSHDFNHFYTEKQDSIEGLLSVGQPSVVYGRMIDLRHDIEKEKLMPLGHGHRKGTTGELFRDFDSLNTALWLIDQIIVRIRD